MTLDDGGIVWNLWDQSYARSLEGQTGPYRYSTLRSPKGNEMILTPYYSLSLPPDWQGGDIEGCNARRHMRPLFHQPGLTAELTYDTDTHIISLAM
jgi:hypothetical protein